MAATEEKLQRRQAVRAGSPLHRGETVPQADTWVRALCHQCKPHAAFIAIGDRTAADNLARHVADKHAPLTASQAACLWVSKIV